MLLGGFIRSLKERLLYESDSNTSEGRTTPLHCSILIRKLMEFYEEYDKVNQFVEAVRALDVRSKEINYGRATLKNGMYLRALYDGITDVNRLYAGDLGKLERAIVFNGGNPALAVRDPSRPNSSSVYAVSTMHNTYFIIRQFIDSVVENNLNGCQILDLCLKCKYSLPDEAFCILLNYLNKPLLKQITSWIVFGVLEDPRNEFFIQHVDSFRPGVTDNYETQSTCSYSSGPQTSTSEMTEEIYNIDSIYLPSHVSFSLANKILNIGNLVSLLRQAPVETESLPEIQNGDFGINELEIIKIMKDLENNYNFHFTEVEKVVHKVWISVNKQLKKLAEEVGGLFIQHRMLMDVFIMQRGELMSDFIKRAMHTLQTDARKTSSHSLNSAFRNAIADASPNISNYQDRLVFHLPPKNAIPEGTLCISVLEVHYRKPWPLHFIFSTDVMEKYNTIFRFLLGLKIAHLNLMSVWNECLLITPGLSTAILSIRAKLLSLLINLENYFFVDIIQSENEIWEAAVEKAQTFNDIKLLHMRFLSNILLNMFFIENQENNEPGARRKSVDERKIGRMIVHNEIIKLFMLNNQFCEAVKNKRDNREVRHQLKKINSSFKEGIKNIIKLVHNTYRENDPPRQLLVRLNYNNFYSPL